MDFAGGLRKATSNIVGDSMFFRLPTSRRLTLRYWTLTNTWLFTILVKMEHDTLSQTFTKAGVGNDQGTGTM